MPVSYEAMAAGLPVICTDCSGAVLDDGVEGFVVPARDARALKEAIQRLHESQSLRAEFGKAARRKIEADYTWAHYRHRLVDTYLNISGTTIRAH